MDITIVSVALVVLMAYVFYAYTRVIEIRTRGVKLDERSPSGGSMGHTDGEARADAPASGAGTEAERLKAMAAAAEPAYDEAEHPRELIEDPHFEAAVEMLAGGDSTVTRLIDYQSGRCQMVAWMALEALNRRLDTAKEGDEIIDAAVDGVLSSLGVQRPWGIFFALRVLDHARKPVLTQVLLGIRCWPMSHAAILDLVNDFIARLKVKGVEVRLGPVLDDYPHEAVSMLERILADLAATHGVPLTQELDAWKAEHLDLQYLRGIGRVWDAEHTACITVEHPDFIGARDRIEHTLFGVPARSVLIVGPAGAGKTALVKSVAARALEGGWHFFEARADAVNAGQKFVGELEARVKELAEALSVRRHVVWYVPDFHHLLYSGRTNQRETGLLELFLPWIEDGRLLVLGETQPGPYERASREIRQIEAVFERVRVAPTSDETTLEIARAWDAGFVEAILDEEGPAETDNDSAAAAKEGTARVCESFDTKPLGGRRANEHGKTYGLGEKRRRGPTNDDVLTEAHELAKHFIAYRAAPGRLVDLIKLTHLEFLSEKGRTGPLTDQLLHACLSRMTGLPLEILDEQRPLDVDALRAFFAARVLGQAEATECLIERMSMIKAGLTDPTRPAGVFLFAGPTGTGKTEIAKTLAHFLFGSPDRLIRLDMSEFKAPDSVARIIGSADEKWQSKALVHRIRRQPFSVVLLDEFEKAHPEIWDLFLQVFDDGRLSDAGGETADFRHSIIILTSNLGSAVRIGDSVGFESSAVRFSRAAVERAIRTTFRPEFVNRLDRVVVFRPLDPATMRDIIRCELDIALERRGLRRRQWTFEFEESAIDFLLEKGFTADLGARPLKRAIEQHLLTPLAMTIVQRQFPSGDQRLVIRRFGGGIQGEFVTVDQEAATPHEPSESPCAIDQAFCRNNVSRR